MERIESVDAKHELVRIDKILSTNHLLIGGLAVKHYHPARKSKDIDLVCSDDIRNKIIDELYPTKFWNIFDENDDEERPDYHITHKKENLLISFGPKITEREPYENINWEDLLNNHSQSFSFKGEKYNKIRIPTAAALAYTKLLAFINRKNGKEVQDLKDFINLTNHKSCSLDDLYTLIDNTDKKDYLKNNFWGKILSDNKYVKIVDDGNIFKFADFFHNDMHYNEEIYEDNQFTLSPEDKNKIKEAISKFTKEVFSYDEKTLKRMNFDVFIFSVLQCFVQFFIGSEEGRFTIRKVKEKDNKMVMEAFITTRENSSPRDIPLDETNMISESAKRGGVPLIYSENKNFHYTSIGENKSNNYIEYVTYCFHKKNNNPFFSVNLDVSTENAAKKLRYLVHTQLFEILCSPIIDMVKLESK